MAILVALGTKLVKFGASSLGIQNGASIVQLQTSISFAMLQMRTLRLGCAVQQFRTISSWSVRRNILQGLRRFPAVSKSRNLWPLTETDGLSKAFSDAEKIVGYPTSFLSLRCLLSDEISNVAMLMKKLVGSKHPLVQTARGFVYDGEQTIRQIRGLLVLLISKAARPCMEESLDLAQEPVGGIYPSQRQLAEITEMIYTAYVIHTGVVDLASIVPSDEVKDMEFGNKMAVLSGDFLLANACTGLAQLRNTEVVHMISKVIGELMEGEVMGNHFGMEDLKLEYWKDLVFKRKGSLIANSCKAALKLVGHTEKLQEDAYQFGKNIALAQQLREDLQKFPELKAPLNLLSTPVVVSALEPQVKELIQRILEKNNPKEESQKSHKELLNHIRDGNSFSQMQGLCEFYSSCALDSLGNLPHSEAKQALENIIYSVAQ